MPINEEWIPASQALTVEALFAQDCAVYFQYDNRIYLGFLESEPLPEGQGICYKAIERATASPTRFLGSTVVTPVTCQRVTLP